MLIWTNFDSVTITSLIEVARFKNLIRQLMLHLILCKQKKTWN